MLKIIQKIYSLPLLLSVLLLMASSASAGAPAGDSESLDIGLRTIVEERLDAEGYMGHYYRDALRRGISAYLWDNRHRLTSVDFPKARQVDVLVCLMMKKGYSEFDKYASEIKEWCSQIIKAP